MIIAKTWPGPANFCENNCVAFKARISSEDKCDEQPCGFIAVRGRWWDVVNGKHKNETMMNGKTTSPSKGWGIAKHRSADLVVYTKHVQANIPTSMHNAEVTQVKRATHSGQQWGSHADEKVWVILKLVKWPEMVNNPHIPYNTNTYRLNSFYDKRSRMLECERSCHHKH